jgi:FkbM family methyltransferase
MERFEPLRLSVSSIKRFIVSLFEKFGYSIVISSELRRLQEPNFMDTYIQLLSKLPLADFGKLAPFLTQAKSQLGQDLFVLHQTQFKRGGYFVEFGATNGLNLSNSYLLEKEFDWSGILAEPARVWHKELSANRSAHIEKKCVWTHSDQKLLFNETSIPEISTICDFSDKDFHGEIRMSRKKYEVETISLNALLQKYDAPEIMDYLSIDTEGSELEILKSFNFEKYRFRVITVEHNYTESRQAILDLLSRNGYERVFEESSQFDDWFVLI